MKYELALWKLEAEFRNDANETLLIAAFCRTSEERAALKATSQALYSVADKIREKIKELG